MGVSTDRPKLAAGLMLVLVALACGKDRQSEAAAARRAATLVVSTATDPVAIFPPLVTVVEGTIISDQIFYRLAEPDSTLNITNDSAYTPRLADRWDWSRDSLSIAFHLNPKARWHDGYPVTANDVRFTHKLYVDSATGSAAAPLLSNIDSIAVRDSQTAVMWFKHRSPLQFFDATYQMRTLPAHLLDTIPLKSIRTSAYARAPIGSGPYRLRSWQQGVSVELASDSSHYRGRPKFRSVFFAVSRDQNAALLKTLSGEADFLDYISPTDLQQVASRPNVRILRWPSLEEGALHFNLRDTVTHQSPHPIFGDERVRHAIALALDRDALVAGSYESSAHVARGPIASALLDTTIFAESLADSVGAAALLESAGWRPTADGLQRVRNGRPLRFSILFPGSSAPRKRLAVLIQAQLKRVGIQVDIEETDLATQMKRADDGTFDATLLATTWDPSPSTAEQQWTIAADVPGGSNYGSYRNQQFDALLAGARVADPARARVLYRRAWTLLAANAPAIWLYDLDNVGLVNRTLHPYGLRADAWWGDLSRWSRDSTSTPP